MSVAPGTRLGPYEIVAPIGAGGMGEVYKARDTRLDRTVAIKVLPASLAGDPQFKERFDREARTISQLNHPHICTLHDVGHVPSAIAGQASTDYLVLEYLEGQTLAERIAEGPLPIADAVRIGIEICDALDRAHSAGVVHRDLKPGNVMLVRRGGAPVPAAKLLDFGLAKDRGHASPTSGLHPSVSAPMTLTSPLTAQGTILGTFQYMSPEQIEGQDADTRSDIWAFGCVLYEMVTGIRAFEGKSPASLMASILKEAPRPLADFVAVPSAALDRVIRPCLAKDPEARWQSIRDLRRELEWIAAAPAESTVVQRPRRSIGAVLWPAAAFVAGALIVAAVLGWRRAPDVAVSRSIELTIPLRLTERRALLGALAPDQSAVAYVAPPEGGDDTLLWVRRFADADPQKIEGTDRASWPFWSPDGKEVAYFASEKLWAVAAGGGKPRPICDAKYGVGGAWNERGQIIFASAFLTGLSRVDAASGKVETLTTLDAKRGESLHGWPVFLSGGDRFLFLSRTKSSEVSRIEIGSMDGRHTAVVDADSLVGYSRGRLLFVRNGILWAQPFDLKTGSVSGKAVSIVDDVRYSESWATAGAAVLGDTLVYVPYEPTHVLASWFDAAGRKLADAFEDQAVSSLRFSRDGTRLVINRTDPAHGADDVWVIDLARNTRNRLVVSPGDEDAGMFSADGRHIYYSSDVTGPYTILRRDAEGLTPAETVVTSPTVDWHPNDISPDGKWLIATDESIDDLWIMPVAEPARRTKWLATEFVEAGARFSPDGRWVTFNWNRSGKYEVYVRSFEGGPPIALSGGGGYSPKWSADGRTIYYLAPGDRLMATDVTVRGGILTSTTPRVVLTDPAIREVEPAPDGRLLIMTRTSSDTQTLRVRIGMQ